MSNSGPGNKARRNMFAAALAAGAMAPAMARLISTHSSESGIARSVLPQRKQLFQDVDWKALIGSRIYTYHPGTLLPKTTYQDAALTIANPHPIIPNSTDKVVMYGDELYRIILKDTQGSTIWDRDNVGVVELIRPMAASDIGNGGETVAQSFDALQLAAYTDMRSYVGPRKSIYLTGYLATARPSGVAGWFVRDTADTTSADDGGTLIVSRSGVRWRRQFQSAIEPRWFGALTESQLPGFDSGAAIQAAKMVAEARKLILLLPNGTLNCSSDIVINPGTTIYGSGQEVSEIKMTGTAKFISLRKHTVDFADLRDFKIRQGGKATCGLDIGTLRRSAVTNVYVIGFKVGVALDMGVNLVANYWNRLTNVTAECTGQSTAGSIGFLFGNNIHTTYPDTDYNILIGCKSFQCETAIFGMNAIGCNVTGHQCTVVGTALKLHSGNNNRIQLIAENCLRMGSATAAANGNILDLYNDGDLAMPFEDNGWNFHVGQIIGQQKLANDAREIDSFVRDRINSAHSAASRRLFVVKTDALHAAYTVTTTCSGYVTGTQSFASIQVWDVIRTSGAIPVVTLIRTTGASQLFTTVAANGEVVWSINGSEGVLSVANTTVNIQGFSTIQQHPYAKFIDYKRAF